MTFSLLEDCYIIQPNIGVSDSVRKMVGELCEMGWMYRKIIEYINMNVDETSIGIVTQSFCFALHQELTEYYRLIALLEQ